MPQSPERFIKFTDTFPVVAVACEQMYAAKPGMFSHDYETHAFGIIGTSDAARFLAGVHSCVRNVREYIVATAALFQFAVLAAPPIASPGVTTGLNKLDERFTAQQIHFGIA